LPAPLSAKRIFSPSMVRNCGWMPLNEMLNV
jgi:hypothetical protein